MDWELEAKRQAAECGELKITLAKRLETVNRKVSERQKIITKNGTEIGLDAELAKEICKILETDLQDEAAWLKNLIGDSHE